MNSNIVAHKEKESKCFLKNSFLFYCIFLLYYILAQAVLAAVLGRGEPRALFKKLGKVIDRGKAEKVGDLGKGHIARRHQLNGALELEREIMLHNALLHLAAVALH